MPPDRCEPLNQAVSGEVLYEIKKNYFNKIIIQSIMFHSLKLLNWQTTKSGDEPRSLTKLGSAPFSKSSSAI